MKEKFLVTRLGYSDLSNNVIYGHEVRIIDLVPYGPIWTDEYLSQLQNKINNQGNEEENDVDVLESSTRKNEYLVLAYHVVNLDLIQQQQVTPYENITAADIEPFVTFARIKKVIKKDNGTWSLVLAGISRHIWKDMYNAEGKKTKLLSEAVSMQTTKVSYNDDVDQYVEATAMLTHIEEAVTQLAQTPLWAKITYSIIANSPYSSINANTDKKILSEYEANMSFSSLIDVVSSISYFSGVDSLTKLKMLSSENIEEAIKLISNFIRRFYFIKDLSPKEKKQFEDIKLFNDLIGKRKMPKELEDNSIQLLPTKSQKPTVTKYSIEDEINEKVKDNLEKQQREYLLKEKLKSIKEILQLEDLDPEEEESEYSKTMRDDKKAKMFPNSVTKLIKNETSKLKGMMSGTPDANITGTYIKTLKSLPWRKVEIETLDIKKAREILDKNHYGLGEVKERIIEYLSLIINHKNQVSKNKNATLLDFDKEHQIDLELFKENQEKTTKIQKNFNNVPILTLVGPPGTGKTSLARAIAEALNKSYIKISLGGVHDESEIRGHRRTYVGSMPGKIIKALQKTGVSNPLILLDEIDKMSSDYKGDPSSAMLEVLDPEQNTKFQDNYLEHEYDLSKVMFIATANYYENIPAPLLDRVEIIELNSYTTSEKIKIAREHLIETSLRQAHLNSEQFQIEDDVIEAIIKNYTAEAGVRGLKRQFDKLARKIVTRIVSGEKIETFKIDKQVAFELLGTPRFSEKDQVAEPQVGVVNGLAYTSIGGSTLQIEVSAYPSKNGGFKLTGSLKDVMKESAAIAYSYVRSNAQKFDIDFNFEENEVHIHVPEGAVPKDGPSAGVTFTTALVSALSNKAVKQDVAMTGEITLRGRVLEIGGLKEKSFAAYKKGVTTVFIPKANQKNLKDIAQEVKDAIKFIPVENYDEIYEVLFK
ncbi:endopeptidase La [Mycoplasmopsis phocirhinis]|uniref:Lon protease n=1 Tax=Mycoplasmopsis phocirhinis TaxID=142650 RepID=A0A4P6MRS0_9BACT|nr:endopeptidase La [Mycoplasmopsis phocirhinis]QBF34531.1 endopeptidase La [Mycoplasmopsis phocirhinis]